jgi:hypothetical protein
MVHDSPIRYIHATLVDSTQGHGGLFVNQKTKHRKVLRTISNRAHGIIRHAATHRASCDVQLQPTPKSLHAYTAGVYINGKKWSIGTPCFFLQDGDEPTAKNFGTVKMMYHWQDRFAATLMIKVERHVLNTDGLQFWVESIADLPPLMIFWTQITWRCHMSDSTREGRPMKKIVRVSTTKPVMDGIDFDGFM